MPDVFKRTGHRTVGYTRNPGSEWIDNNRSTLPDKKWVASDGTRLIAEDSSFDGLMVQLKDRHVSMEDMAIAFISSDPV